MLLLPQTAAAKSWHFQNFDSQITINKDSTFEIKENITAQFNGQFSWFKRDIPYQRMDYISDIVVTDLDSGKQLSSSQAEIDTDSGGAVITIRQPIKDQLKNWQIKYLVHGGIGYFSDYDELYFNTVPSERDVRIDQANVTIALPSNVSKDQWKDRILTEGKVDSGFEVQNDKTVKFWAKDLPAQTNFTIVLGWPKEIVDYQRNRTKTFQVIGIILPILTLIIAIVIWFYRLKDASGRGTIAPEFVPPTDDPPILIEALSKESITANSLTASLINLARKGYIKIIQKQTKGFLGTKTDFKFEKLKDFNGLGPIEKKFATQIFGSKDSVKASDLKDSFYTDFKKIKEDAFKETVNRKWFTRNPESTKIWYICCGMAVMFLLFFIGIMIAGLYKGGGWIAFGGIMSGIILMILASTGAKKTKEGKIAQEKWQGFKMFLSQTERFKAADLGGKNEKLKELGTNVFEQYLAYALVMGVAQNWTNRFKDLELQQPDWYQGNVGTGYTALVMHNSMTSLNTSASTTMLHSPGGGSGYGGGSGFGGGGSAGGGGGGGGASAG